MSTRSPISWVYPPLQGIHGAQNSFGDVVALLDDAPVVHGVALVDANGDGIAEIVAGGTNHGTLMWAADRTV